MFPYLNIGEISIDLYSFFNNIVAIVVLIIYNFIRVNEKKTILTYPSQKIVYKAMLKDKAKVNKVEKRCAIVEAFIISLVVVLVISNVNQIFGDLIGTFVNYFGTIFSISFVFYFISIILKTNPLKQMDFVAMVLPLTLTPIKIACFMTGCCYGIPFKYGLYNQSYEGVQVPVQLIEAGCAFAIFLYMRKKRATAKTGTLFPIFVILYCATRFFSEFLRAEENVFLIFKEYHILCAIGFVFGLVHLAVVLKFGDKITAYYDKKYDEIKEKVKEKVTA